MKRRLSLPVWKLSLAITLAITIGISAVELADGVTSRSSWDESSARTSDNVEELCKTLTSAPQCDRGVVMTVDDSSVYIFPSTKRSEYLRKQRELEEGATKVTFETPFLTNVFGDADYVHFVSRPSLKYLLRSDLVTTTGEMELRHEQILKQIRDGTTTVTAIFEKRSLHTELKACGGDDDALESIRSKYQTALDIARAHPDNLRLVMVDNTQESLALIQDVRGTRWVAAGPQAQQKGNTWWSQRIFSDPREATRLEREIDLGIQARSAVHGASAVALLDEQLRSLRK